MPKFLYVPRLLYDQDTYELVVGVYVQKYDKVHDVFEKTSSQQHCHEDDADGRRDDIHFDFGGFGCEP